MRTESLYILACILVGVSGCLCNQPSGDLVDDPQQKAVFLESYRHPEVTKVVFRTLINWGVREVSLVEVVKALPDGGFSVAGLTDVGNTLYAVQIDSSGKGRVLSKALPFSDRWLLEGLVTELLVPWHGPTAASRLYQFSGGTRALVEKTAGLTNIHGFDESGKWRQSSRFSGCRLTSRTTLEWDDGTIPVVMRTDNPGKHYSTVRERVSSE